MRALLSVLLVAGCYQAVPPECQVQCSEVGLCPPGTSCASDGFCHAPDETQSCLAVLDARPDAFTYADAPVVGDARDSGIPPDGFVLSDVFVPIPDAFVPIPDANMCGDFTCQPTETCVTCPWDCPIATCGDGACDFFDECDCCPADCALIC